MLEPTIDGWSVKDHLAHMAFWDDLRAADIERIRLAMNRRPMTASSEQLNDIVQGAAA
jgi:hypothetical protein